MQKERHVKTVNKFKYRIASWETIELYQVSHYYEDDCNTSHIINVVDSFRHILREFGIRVRMTEFALHFALMPWASLMPSSNRLLNSFGGCTPVCKAFSIQIFYQDYPVLWAAAIHISSCKAKYYCLSSVITEQVKFETMISPCYRCLWLLCIVFYEVIYYISYSLWILWHLLQELFFS